MKMSQVFSIIIISVFSLGLAVPVSNADEISKNHKFDGQWTATLKDCGTVSYGGQITYDFQLQVTSGEYRIRVTAGPPSGSVSFTEDGETLALQGPVGLDGRISDVIRLENPANDPNLEILLSLGNKPGQLSFDNCRTVMKATSFGTTDLFAGIPQSKIRLRK